MYVSGVMVEQPTKLSDAVETRSHAMFATTKLSTPVPLVMRQFQSSPADIVSVELVSSNCHVAAAVHEIVLFPSTAFFLILTVVAVALAVLT